MANKIKTLTLIEKSIVLGPSSEQGFSFVPDLNAEVVIELFRGNYTVSQNAAICCVWDFGEAGEVMVDMVNSGIKNKVATGDGVKKFALIFVNNESVNNVAYAATVVVAEIVDA